VPCRIGERVDNAEGEPDCTLQPHSAAKPHQPSKREGMVPIKVANAEPSQAVMLPMVVPLQSRPAMDGGRFQVADNPQEQ
jgi:hypothetical protein